MNLIDRDALLSEAKKLLKKVENDTKEQIGIASVMSVAYELPVFDTPETRKSKWVLIAGDVPCCYACSRIAKDTHRFCPSCGAEMEEVCNG